MTRDRIAWGAMLAAVVVGWRVQAFAAGGGLEDTAFRSILLLIAVVGAAYVVAHSLVEYLEQRYAFVTGVEYLLLGVMVGPVMGWIDGDTFNQLKPALTIGTGAVGLLAGLQLDLSQRADQASLSVEGASPGLKGKLGGLALNIDLSQKVSPGMTFDANMTNRKGLGVMGGLIVSGATFGMMSLVPLLVGLGVIEVEGSWRWLPAVATAVAVAMVADGGPVRSIASALTARGRVVKVMLQVATTCSALAIVVVGLVAHVHEGTVVVGGLEGTWWQWFVAEVMGGVILGLLTAVFLRQRLEQEQLLTVLLGVILFTSGVAAQLEMSALFVSFVVGVMLRMLLGPGHAVEQMLSSTQRPFTIVLFFFAGLAFDPQASWWSWVLVLPFVGLRVAGRMLGGMWLGKAKRCPNPGPALLAPGGLSVAMMVGFRLNGGAWASSEVYAMLLGAVLVSEFLSYRWTRRWLIDAADVPTVRVDAMTGEFTVPGGKRG
jgi:Kef-type K+ transport system membrane component KefB